jgi:hypothetical protein
LLGGTFEIDATVGGGVTVTAELPLDNPVFDDRSPDEEAT